MLLQLRANKLTERGLPWEAVLPVEAQKEVWKLVKESYAREPKAQERMAAMGKRGWSSDRRSRQLESWFKAVLFDRVGGHVWTKFLIAIGHLGRAVVDLVNNEITQRTEKGEQRKPTKLQHPAGASKTARLSFTEGAGHRRRPASSRAAIEAEEARTGAVALPPGIKHKITAAREARKDAARARKAWLGAGNRGWVSRGGLAWLEDDYTRKAAYADRLTCESGCGGKLSDGTWAQGSNVDSSLVGIVMREWGLHHDEGDIDEKGNWVENP